MLMRFASRGDKMTLLAPVSTNSLSATPSMCAVVKK
jgi:hypothetical protein